MSILNCVAAYMVNGGPNSFGNWQMENPCAVRYGMAYDFLCLISLKILLAINHFIVKFIALCQMPAI